MIKFFPKKNQWKRWSLPSKLGVIAAYLGIILTPFSIWSFFTPNTIVYNIYNSNKEEVIKAKEDNFEKEDNTNSTKFISYSLVGYNNQFLIREIENKGKIKIDNISLNKIVISSTVDIISYGNVSNKIYKSLKGELQISVNDCILTFGEFTIPSFGPSPKSMIENDINKEIENIIKNNTKVISEKIHTCIN